MGELQGGDVAVASAGVRDADERVGHQVIAVGEGDPEVPPAVARGRV